VHEQPGATQEPSERRETVKKSKKRNKDEKGHASKGGVCFEGGIVRSRVTEADVSGGKREGAGAGFDGRRTRRSRKEKAGDSHTEGGRKALGVYESVTTSIKTF
jgi:hypothetical protein